MIVSGIRPTLWELLLVTTFQPEVGRGINDAHHRPGRHVSGGQVVAVVARVVPDLVHAAYMC